MPSLAPTRPSPPRALQSTLQRLPHDAAAHFRLWLLAALARLLGRLAAQAGSFEAAFQQHPFLEHYGDELAQAGLSGTPVSQAATLLCRQIHLWEDGVAAHLPLSALARAHALDDEAMLLLCTAGLPEEDSRFGALFEQLNGAAGARRPCAGLIHTWWAGGRCQALDRLLRLGLLRTADAELPRADWPLSVPPSVWQALRGEAASAAPAWLRWRPPADLRALEELVLTPQLKTQTEALLPLLRDRSARGVLLRGAPHNGRRTLLGAVARALGLGLLELPALPETAARWSELSLLATLMQAMPVLTLHAAPGQTLALADWPECAPPLGLTIERSGGVGGAGAAALVQLELPLPEPEERSRHWQAAGVSADRSVALGEAFRIGRGQLHRAARQAQLQARLQPRSRDRGRPDADDVAAALQGEHRLALETVAQALPAGPGWGELVLPPATLAELRELHARCLLRERLAQTTGDGAAVPAHCGVRALFKGASGTGKTLAARVLASELRKPLYRMDLSTIVDKYIGETEKNLERAFARAEEHDVVLLLDEGDALLTRRTEVSTANDRYANLETNYLLQRVESYSGILLVTTNAGERIDRAFARRMDAELSFPLPQADERLALWRLHLSREHGVDEATLWQVAYRCAFSGGQIRNAALQARLASLRDARPIDATGLLTALRREYLKLGEQCPLADAPNA